MRDGWGEPMGGAGRLAAGAAPWVRQISPYQPGKPVEELEREYGIADAIKLASNENPLGPPPAALAAIRNAAASVALYPDGSGHYLRQALARELGLAAEQLVLGNGSNDVLVLLAEAFLKPGDEAVYSEYAFLVYPLAVQATGARARIAPALPAEHPEQPLGHDPEALADCVSDKTRLLFVANPNNPTGSWLDAAALQGLLDRVPETTLVVVDEAYAEYVAQPGYPPSVDWLERYPNLVITRTFSKAYGLAGLRIGYAIAGAEICELLNRIRQPFNTSTVAQAAALAALGEQAFLRRSRELNAAGLRQLGEGLAELGFRPLPSAGNFLLVDLGEPALPWYEALLRDGIIVRPVGNYGLPNHLRITVGLPEQNERLLASLAARRRRGR